MKDTPRDNYVAGVLVVPHRLSEPYGKDNVFRLAEDRTPTAQFVKIRRTFEPSRSLYKLTEVTKHGNMLKSCFGINLSTGTPYFS